MKYIQLFILLLLGMSWSVSSVAQSQMKSQGSVPVQSQDSRSCGTHISPEQADYVNQELREYRRTRKEDFQRDNNATIYIPVQFHLISDSNGYNGGYTGSFITSELATLNEYYAPANIEFYECGSYLEIHDDDLFSPLNYPQDEIDTGAYNVEDVINIYYADELIYGFWGYTYVPGTAYVDDLVMMDYDAIGSFTLVHELAHFFSVYHTHGILNSNCGTNELVDGSNCDTHGDGICDTPADPNLGCWPPDAACNYTGIAYVNPYTGVAVAPDYPTDLNGASYDPITNNIMSYGNYHCQAGFTPGQYDRILDGYHTFRTYLTGGTCSNTPVSDDCFTSIDLIDDIDGPASETASNFITASNVITDPAAVLMSAGNHIILEDEFHAESGSYVNAYIQGCVNSNKTNGQVEQTANEVITKLSAYPNPMDNMTNIEYDLTEATSVNVAIYDINGKMVSRLLNGESKEAGSHTMTINTEDLAAGTYICTLQAGSFVENIKLLIIR